jgi:hypothetical protein
MSTNAQEAGKVFKNEHLAHANTPSSLQVNVVNQLFNLDVERRRNEENHDKTMAV